MRASHLDLAFRPNPKGHARVGVVVPRYQFTAVARNRLRRRVKEILRRDVLRLPALTAVDLVVRAKRAAYAASFAALRAELTDLVSRIT